MTTEQFSELKSMWTSLFPDHPLSSRQWALWGAMHSPEVIERVRRVGEAGDQTRRARRDHAVTRHAGVRVERHESADVSGTGAAMTNLEALKNYARAAAYAHEVLPTCRVSNWKSYESVEVAGLADLRRTVESWREKDDTPAFAGFPKEPKTNQSRSRGQACPHFSNQPWYMEPAAGPRKCLTCEREAAEQRQFESFASATGSKQLTTVARGRKIVENLMSPRSVCRTLDSEAG